MTNMNSGYSGWSMSLNAVAAYEGSEKPKSKWTKSAMLAEIDGYLDECGLTLDIDVSKLTKAEIFDRFFEWSSWHHTSKFANVTDFYSLNEEALVAAARPRTEAELTERQAKLEAMAEVHAKKVREEREQRARHNAKLIQKDKARAAYIAAHDYAPDSLLAYMACHPERCTVRESKRSGRMCVFYAFGGDTVHTCLLEEAAERTVWGFSDLNEATVMLVD